MITALDSNILIDIIGGDPRFGETSRAAVEMVGRQGSLVVSPEVVAEFTTGCGSIESALDALDALRVTYVGIDLQAAGIAGLARARSRVHRRITADYLIAAHAARHADRLLTRDADVSTLDVPGLRAVTPTQVLAGSGN